MITSASNPQIKNMIQLQKKAKARWQQILGISGVSEAKRLQVSEYISFVNETMPRNKEQKTEK